MTMLSSARAPHKSNIWYRSEHGWRLMWACLDGGVIRLYENEDQQARGLRPALWLDLARLLQCQQARSESCNEKRYEKCIQLTLAPEEHSELLDSRPEEHILAAESPLSHAKWWNNIEALVASRSEQNALSWMAVDLSPSPEAVAFLCCRHSSLIQAVHHARNAITDHGGEDLDRRLHAASASLRDLHGAIIGADVELAEDASQDPRVFFDVGSNGSALAHSVNRDEVKASKASKDWLSHMQKYVVNMLRELDACVSARRCLPDQERRCAMLVNDICGKLDAVTTECGASWTVERKNGKDVQSKGATACATAGKRLVPSSRQEYKRYWQSKVCL